MERHTLRSSPKWSTKPNLTDDKSSYENVPEVSDSRPQATPKRRRKRVPLNDNLNGGYWQVKESKRVSHGVNYGISIDDEDDFEDQQLDQKTRNTETVAFIRTPKRKQSSAPVTPKRPSELLKTDNESVSNSASSHSPEVNNNDGFMPNVENAFKFKDGSPATGRSANELDHLLTPRKASGKWPMNAQMPSISYKRLGDLPPPGLADRLVKEMERDEEDDQKRIARENGDEWLDEWWDQLPMNESTWIKEQRRRYLP